MPYSAEISRSNPTCFLFLIDQSKSMLDAIGGGQGNKKADAVADSLNRLLYTLVLRCVWGQSVLDRFHVGVVGYGRQIVPALGGALAGRELVPISELARTPLRVEQRVNLVDDGSGGQVEQVVKMPIWFEAAGDGKTPMCKCLEHAARIMSSFLLEHPACYPPLIINLSDGEATDGNPEGAAQNLRELASEDGAVLLFNGHISSRSDQAIEFPDSEADLPDEYARRLFRMSSRLPPAMQNSARQAGLPVTADSRGFVFNADLASVVRFLDIGTRVDLKNLR
ncbi:MAG: VWA domain-containing protein [Gemmataceae bacterium]